MLANGVSSAFIEGMKDAREHYTINANPYPQSEDDADTFIRRKYAFSATEKLPHIYQNMIYSAHWQHIQWNMGWYYWHSMGMLKFTKKEKDHGSHSKAKSKRVKHK